MSEEDVEEGLVEDVGDVGSSSRIMRALEMLDTSGDGGRTADSGSGDGAWFRCGGGVIFERCLRKMSKRASSKTLEMLDLPVAL